MRQHRIIHRLRQRLGVRRVKRRENPGELRRSDLQPRRVFRLGDAVGEENQRVARIELNLAVDEISMRDDAEEDVGLRELVDGIAANE